MGRLPSIAFLYFSRSSLNKENINYDFWFKWPAMLKCQQIIKQANYVSPGLDLLVKNNRAAKKVSLQANIPRDNTI